MNYKFKYNWTEFPSVMIIIKRIQKNTFNNLNNENKTGVLINYLEDYLRYFVKYGYDLSQIVYKLHNLDSIDLVTNLFPVKEINTNRKHVCLGRTLVINNNTYSDKLLSKIERIRLNLYVGLSHYLIDFDEAEAEYFNGIYSSLNDFSPVKPEYVTSCGWKALENTMAEELGETITYDILNYKQPEKRIGIEKQDYLPVSDNLVISNLEMYRVFDSLMPKFARTINCLNPQDEYETKLIINNLLRKAVNDNIVKAIITDYMSHGNEFELYAFLYLLGLLSIEKEANMSNKPLPELKLDKHDGDKLYDEINRLLNIELILNADEYNEKHEVEYDKVSKNSFVKSRLKKLISERNI